MAGSVPQTSKGNTITFGGGWVSNVQEIDPPSPKVDSLDVTQQTSTVKTKIPAPFVDNNEISIKGLHDANNAPPVGVQQAITVSYAPSGAQTIGPQQVFQGFMMSYNPKGVINKEMNYDAKVVVCSTITNWPGN